MKIRNRAPHRAPKWMSISDAARALGITRQAAHARAEAGTLPGARRRALSEDGRWLWHVSKDLFEAALRRQARKEATP